MDLRQYRKGAVVMLSNGWNVLSSWIKDEEGASLVEYVLMVALIAVVCIAAVTLLGNAAKDKFNFTAEKIKG
jgi:pilus assembly protein Flp/PilA